MSELTLIKKITVSKLGLDKAIIREACKNEPCALFTVFGFITGVEKGETDLGDFVRLIGKFEVSQHITGEIYRSRNLILPEFIALTLEDSYNEAASVEGFTALQFAVEVGAEYSKVSPTEYEYTVKNLMQSEETDILSAMRNQVLKISKD